MISKLLLHEPLAGSPIKITQLYEQLELYSAGDPPQQTLFVLGRPPLVGLPGVAVGQEQLLIIDPPPDAAQRFRLTGQVAVLFTGPPQTVGLPLVQTQVGGLAHLRIGEHFLDVYSQPSGNVIYLPAVGLLCGGGFGSDALVPQLAAHSDGAEELATLRLLARLVKQPGWRLYLPHTGTTSANQIEILNRLAADVAYLHHLRRVAPGLAQYQGDPTASAALGDSLLPADRRSPASQAVHRTNLQQLV